MEVSMAEKRGKKSGGRGGLGGILGGFTDLIEKLGELAEKGEQLSRAREFQWKGMEKDLKGVYGFSVKVGLGGEEVKVEPFGNIRRDEKSGQPVVQEVREPVIDVLEEEDHVLVLAEMPGIEEKDVRLDVKDDVLTIYAERANKKYRKEVLLPRICPREKMLMSCNNGILEITCTM
jgi:HSP20 family protein